jgi:hypothetical protein
MTRPSVVLTYALQAQRSGPPIVVGQLTGEPGIRAGGTASESPSTSEDGEAVGSEDGLHPTSRVSPTDRPATASHRLRRSNIAMNTPTSSTVTVVVSKLSLCHAYGNRPNVDLNALDRQ